MTKKDYIKISAILKDAYKTAGNCKTVEGLIQSKAAVEGIARDLSRMLADDNTKFNYDKFMKACGIL